MVPNTRGRGDWPPPLTAMDANRIVSNQVCPCYLHGFGPSPSPLPLSLFRPLETKTFPAKAEALWWRAVPEADGHSEVKIKVPDLSEILQQSCRLTSSYYMYRPRY